MDVEVRFCNPLSKKMKVDTGPNPLGVCALAQVEVKGGRAFVLACPSSTIGEVRVWHGCNDARVDVLVHNSPTARVDVIAHVPRALRQRPAARQRRY
jgi:hypothetical protein